ncbi:phosphatidylserine decarboxylase [Oceanibacterium hippocampi]|uniref:Phosphatidylserine decarboxylase proenzyme n=1 Tax=Oceanibacterium hippocampi TaxID=745714 RepID=A0A1Y5U273_9PROT|nr:phosphatidylserine decarboxylase [Oceanibacterium hippocampi]SLN76861.1 phosphatidylserine decarboxylase [Oceanibacterium hippocampi]
METLQSVMTPIHREGHRFIAIFAAVTVVLFLIAAPLGWLGVLLTLWCVYFFRNPDRHVPTREGLIVSPADGVVQLIERAVPPPELDMGSDPRMRISIFLNVFNVHVNRVPADGRITRTVYRPGRFLNAMKEKASEDNERQSVRMTTADGHDIAFVQIAGLVARRIVCDLDEGQSVRAGERFGLIRFGSRTDIYLDDGMVPLVAVGQTTIGGETVLVDSQTGDVAARGAEVR